MLFVFVDFDEVYDFLYVGFGKFCSDDVGYWLVLFYVVLYDGVECVVFG